MKATKSLTALSLVLLALAACGRGGPAAPVEHRGIGTGETSPGMASSASSGGYSGTSSSIYTPPAGYGGGTSSSGSAVQVQTLGEPNDPYSQAATQTNTRSDVRMSPPPAQMYDPNQPLSMQQPNSTGAPRVLGTMPANTPVTSGVPVEPANNAPIASAPEPLANSATEATTRSTTMVNGAIDQGDGSYGWPIRGRLISGYGPKADGQSNDGLNIAAPQGSPVYAAKEGTVAYAGNELRSFGNMVLVRHTGGMFTVYAHLDQIAVTKESPITKGQVVGTVGQSGGVAEPQVHFEVRRGSNPQDPMKYLGR